MVTDTKVELGHGLKVSDKDAGQGCTEVLLLASVARTTGVCYALLVVPGSGFCCAEHQQQTASGQAGVSGEEIF